MAAPAAAAKQLRRPPLGRPSNHLGIGIVGVPNVGKSTLFNLLTKLQVPAQNFPFCTIEPNEARVAIPDERFDFLCEKFKPASKVQAYLQITDIAGLVKGASQGQGLGNAFLSHIRAVDAIFQIVRVFEDEEVTHVEGSVDPVRDLEIITEELLLKDAETVKGRIEAVDKQLKHRRDKGLVAEMEVLKHVEEVVCVQKKPVRFVDWKAADIEVVNSLFLLTAKPVVFLVNMSEGDFLRKKNKWLVKIKQWVDTQSAPYTETIIPFCGKLEAELVSTKMSEAKKAGEESPQVQAAGTLAKIVKTGYAALDLIYFFTCGADEVRCWTIRKGTKAPQAAGVIHTDFEKGFICAEVMTYDDFKELGSESAAKEAGKYRQQGKTYEVMDGDIVFFRANTAAIKKEAKPKP
jgi:obg-like ATPase 1